VGRVRSPRAKIEESGDELRNRVPLHASATRAATSTTCEIPDWKQNWGISKRSYPNLDIKSLTLEQAQAIYKRDYWQQASCERMPPKIAIAVFDAAVHHGPKTAVKLLQRALKVADDGEYGRITHGTLQSARHKRNIRPPAGTTRHLPDHLPGVADLQTRLAQAAV
jgi:hypothetical protein